MGCSKATLYSSALILTLNILFFNMVSSGYCPPDTPKGSAPAKNPPKSSAPATNPPKSSAPATNPPKSSAPAVVVPSNPSPYSQESCPRDTLKLAACANLLNDLVTVVVGTPPKTPCCTLIEGLVDVEAAVCLCTALKANVLGLLNVNLDIKLTLLLNYCGTGVPAGFQCA